MLCGQEKAKLRRGRTPSPSGNNDCEPGKSRRKAAHSSDDSDGSGSGGENDAWQQQLEEQQEQGGAGVEGAGNGKAQREDWMTVPMARSQLMGGGRAGKEIKEEEARENEQQQSRRDPDEIYVSVSSSFVVCFC